MSGPSSTFIFGAGFSGLAIGRLLADGGGRVYGTTRDRARFGDLHNAGIVPLLFDGTSLSDEVRAALLTADRLVVSVAPPRRENVLDPDGIVDPVLRAFEDHTLVELMPKLEWIVYLSTVGVYGNHDGAWIDEETPAAPQSERSRQRVRAEAEWLALGEATGLPVAIMRLSGIYGPGRNALVSAQKGKARRLIKPGQVFNRIVVDDIAQAVKLASAKRAAGIYNITDDEPAPPQDVVAHAHALLGMEAPPEVDFDTADLTPMARSFYGENKRVSNAKSKRELGLDYAYPNYRVALEALLARDG